MAVHGLPVETAAAAVDTQVALRAELNRILAAVAAVHTIAALIKIILLDLKQAMVM